MMWRKVQQADLASLSGSQTTEESNTLVCERWASSAGRNNLYDWVKAAQKGSTLDMSEQEFTSAQVDNFLESLESLSPISNLRVVNLAGNKLGQGYEEDITPLITLLSESCTTITALNLERNSMCSRCPDPGIELARVVKKMPLKVLDLASNHLLSHNRMRYRVLSEVGESLKEQGTLKRLRLASNYLHAEGIKLVAGWFQGLTLLQYIDLSDNIMAKTPLGARTPLGIEHLTASLQGLSALRTLRIQSNDLQDEEASILAGAVATAIKLTSLDVSHNDIGSVGAMKLAKAIRLCGSITNLCIQCNRIKDAGVLALAKEMTHTPKMKTLDICSNGVTSTCVEPLISAAVLNPSLKVYKLRGNALDDDTVATVAEYAFANTQLDLLLENPKGFNMDEQSDIVYDLACHRVPHFTEEILILMKANPTLMVAGPLREAVLSFVPFTKKELIRQSTAVRMIAAHEKAEMLVARLERGKSEMSLFGHYTVGRRGSSRALLDHVGRMDGQWEADLEREEELKS